MTDQIKTVNVYDEARKALAKMALEAKNAAVIATGPENIKAIAALVDAQDARIDVFRVALSHANRTQRAGMQTQGKLELQLESIKHDAQFLLDRIAGWEADGLDGSGEREWHGHVEPAIARLRAAIRARGGKADE